MDRAPLNLASLREQLAGLPLRRLDIVGETGSTNADLLARHAAGEDISGAVLLAEDQSAGRGRNGRSWSAPPRSQIALSIGVSAAGVSPSAWGWLPLLTGVALVDAIRETTGIEAGVKWPNDVLVGTGKLAGILAEVASPEPVIVVGLGLNVTLTPAEAPDPRATSLQMLGASMLDRDVLAAKLEFLAGGTRRSEQSEFAHRKVALLQRFDHFDADGARRTDHCHMRILVHNQSLPL